MNKSLLFIFLLLIISCNCHAQPRLRPSQWAIPVINSELDNFYKVSDKLYRSEQPNSEAISEYEFIGIGAILNLRKHHTDKDEAKASKISLNHIPMAARNVTQEQILQALKTIKTSDKPIVIHCWHGSDRTGVVAAAYRMVFQHWSATQAIDEFENGGYGYHEWLFPNLVELLNTLDVKSIQKQLGLLKPEFIELD
jgi:protein tyrosine phosphatase (PTP) superfamily phosphohydrolase (DUF442 family)